MNKSTRIILVIVLYLLAALLGLNSVGTLVSLKYEVDEGYVFLDMNKSMSKVEREQSIEKLNTKRRMLNRDIFLSTGGALLCLASATALIFKRKRPKLHTKT